MAKRYYSHQELTQIINDDLTANHKPGGTLGSHFMYLEDMGEYIKVTGKSISKGDKNYCPVAAKIVQNYSLEGPSEEILASVKIYPEYTLGYNCGNVWAIKPVHLIKDPLKRACRENKFSMRKIHFVPDFDNVIVGEDDYTSSKCIVERNFIITNRAGMWRKYFPNAIYVLNGTSRKDIAKIISGTHPEEVFGPMLPSYDSVVDRIKKHTYYLNHTVDIRKQTATIIAEYQTGYVHYDVVNNNVICEEGYFKKFEAPFDVMTWKGRGYSGGHNSVHLSMNESAVEAASLIQQGYKGQDITEIGRTSGYYPEVVYWK